MKSHFYVAILMLLMFSCREEQQPAEIVESFECNEIPNEATLWYLNPASSIGVYKANFTGPIFLQLQIDQPTKDYLLYTYADSTMFFGDILFYDAFAAKVNLETHDSEQFSNYPKRTLKHLSVSSKGWILKNDGAFLYKHKTNGDSLQILYQYPDFYYLVNANWNFEGDRILIHLTSVMDDRTLISDENGVLLDTLNNMQKSAPSSWNNTNNLFVAVSNMTIRVYNMNSTSNDSIFSVKPGESVRSIEWIDQERFLWSTDSGLFVTNFVSQETKTLINTCDANYTRSAIYSQKDDRIYFVKWSLDVGLEETTNITTVICSIRPNGNDFKEHTEISPH